MTSIFLEQSWHHHRHGTIRQWAATRGGGEPSGESFDFSQEELVLLPSNMNCLSQALACLFPKQRATCILLHFAISEEREEHRIETSVGHNQPVAWQLFDDFLTGFRIHRANQQWGYGMLWTHVDKCHQMSSNVINLNQNLTGPPSNCLSGLPNQFCFEPVWYGASPKAWVCFSRWKRGDNHSYRCGNDETHMIEAVDPDGDYI